MQDMSDRTPVDFTAPREISGIWIDEFEGSSFHEGVHDLKEARERRHSVWLDMDEDSVVPPAFHATDYGHAYRLTFIGRTARDMHRSPLEGYGHLGVSPGLVRVDRLLQWEDLGPIYGC